MRFKSRTWLVISLLLFAAAVWTWRYAEKVRDAHRIGASPAASAQSGVLRLQHPALIKALETNAPIKRKSYVLRNTTQKLAQLVHNDHALILRNALIDTEVPVGLKIPSHLRAKGAPGSYLVQADRPLDKDFYAEISQAGASYIAYVPNNAALVQASPEQATNLAAHADVVAVLPYEPYYKLDNTLLPVAIEQQAETNALSVTTFPGQRDAALAALTQLGATLLGEDRSPFGPTLIVNIPSQNLVAVAQMPLAQEVEAYTPRHLANDLSRVELGVSADTLLGTSNYLNLTGANVIVSLNDTGVDASHLDFGGPTGLRLQGDPFSLTDGDGHGTHVAGIVAGNGSQSASVTFASGSITPGADFRGKATNANLFVQSLDLLLGPFVSDAYLQENASMNLGPTNLISNNSWGYGSLTYDMHAASFDAATRDAQPNVPGEQPLLFVFAAGNSGNGDDAGVGGQADTINSPATAKNVITVGASDSPRFLTNMVSYDGQTTNAVFYGATDNSNLVAWFSSCGNVGIGVEGSSGRFKPDVVAPGVFIVSCKATNFVDPTNQSYVTDNLTTNQTILPNQTNSYLAYLPSDTSELIIQVSSNAASPKSFPPVLIYADAFTPPTTLRGTNIAFVTNFPADGIWYIDLTTPATNTQPVEFDLNVYVIETNYLGDYFTVLSNMNNTLGVYRYESGTSMSAPAVSGLLALMQEFLQTRMNIMPSPALLKAMLINGSRSLGIQYDFNTSPENPNEQGWGLPNISNSIPASLIGGSTNSPTMVLIDQSTNNALATGQYRTYTISQPDANAANFPLRITLVWTDPPGDPAAGVALVNDLDLTVTDATRTNVYVGNDFLGGDIFTEVSNPTNLPPSDTVNNVENVYIGTSLTPIDFPLTVQVTGSRVNVNAIPGQTNRIAQDYALVISSDDPALASPMMVITNGITNTTPTLITVASNGVPLLHQRVGANEPNLYKYPFLTNGDVSQWHFFIFTNTAFSATNQATNVAFTTFLPPNLSRPRNTDADIDLYVSQNPALFLLTDKVVQKADKSVGRGGTETIIYTNSYANEVYYIGVKSEDQQAADFGFYGIAQQAPFSTQNGDGSVTAEGTSLPVMIPDSVSGPPALVFAFLFSPNNPEMKIRRVTVQDGVAHGNPADLYGTLQHDGLQVVLNHYSGPPGGFTNTYDDLHEDPASGDLSSDGPGSLIDYANQPGQGLWLLTEADSALVQSGEVTQFQVTVDPQPPLTGFFVTIQPNGWFDDYVVVPNDATNLIISAVYKSGGGPIGIYLTNFDDINTGDYGSNNINPPGGFLSLGTNPPPHNPVPYPPLEGGLWFYGIYNQGSTPVTLFVEILIQESLTPNLVQSFTNNADIPLLTDATTESQICVGLGQQVVNLQVGLRIADTNLDDLVIHLTSPQGTSVLLFEDRGGSNANALGLIQLTATNSSETNQFTNYVYTVFTENTNLAFIPIKFAPPPYALSNYAPSVTIASSDFEGYSNGIYYYSSNGTVIDGWTVSNNIITTVTTNGFLYTTNSEVGVVTDTNIAESGTNFLALTSGRITQTFATTPNLPYEILFYVRAPGLTNWWPGDDNAEDIIGTNNGTLSTSTNIASGVTNITPLVTFDDGEVNRAFTFDGVDSSVSFGTNVGVFGTNDFSVDFWLKSTDTNDTMGILEKGSACGLPAGAFGLFLKEGYLKYQDDANPALQSITNSVVTNVLADGIFHYVALVRQAGLISMYVDGLLNTNVISGIANITNTNNLVMGGAGCANVPFLGDLDELDLFNRALSPAEIAAIYSAGSQGKYSTNSVLPNFQLTVDGISTNTIILTNADGGWQKLTNSFVTTNTQVTVEFAGNPLGVLLDDIQFIQLPATNYNDYYLPEEPLTPFVGENPLGCWSLDVWDTRTDSSLPVNGTLLSWTLQLTTSSTNATLFVLTNRVSMTNVVPPNGGIIYFAVDVPNYAQFASNILTAITPNSSLNLLFDQTALPTGGLPGDVALTNNVTASTNVLATLGGLPPLQPGQRYFLGVQNNSSTTPANFTIEVDFDGMTNNPTPLANAIAVTNVIGTNNVGTNGNPQYYSFVVPTNAVQVTFQVLNPTNGEVDLYARNGLPLPGPLTFDYQSRNNSSNDQFIVISTNSVPVPLPTATTNNVLPMVPSIWYLSVYNFAAVTNVGYTIIATVVTNSLDVIPLANGVAYTNNAAFPGYPTNTLYSYLISNSPSGVQFTVTNLSFLGNVELLVGQGIFPTPQESYSGSFNSGLAPQLVQIGTNAALPSLNGTWYLAVPNTSDLTVQYSIEAINLLSPLTVTNAPEFLGARIASPASGFTMYWSAVPGQSYEIDVSTNLTSWSFVTNVIPNSSVGSYTDPVAVQSQTSRFFRLK